MADRFLAGNGLPCPVCNGTGRVQDTGRRAVVFPGWHICPGGCIQGRLLIPPEEIVASMLAENNKGPG